MRELVWEVGGSRCKPDDLIRKSGIKNGHTFIERVKVLAINSYFSPTTFIHPEGKLLNAVIVVFS